MFGVDKLISIVIFGIAAFISIKILNSLLISNAYQEQQEMKRKNRELNIERQKIMTEKKEDILRRLNEMV